MMLPFLLLGALPGPLRIPAFVGLVILGEVSRVARAGARELVRSVLEEEGVPLAPRPPRHLLEK